MKMRQEFRHMAVGLQSSGKTTFAAALWYLIDSCQVNTALVKGKHSGDHRYLETLAERWEEGWQVPRTQSLQQETITMNLRDPGSSADIGLRFVDLPGEVFEKAFATRMLSRGVALAFEQIDNLMLFVSANDVRDDLTMIDFATQAGSNVQEDEINEEASEEIKFNPADTPRQVQVVDFLDSIQQPPLSATLRRIAVIISAWDKAPDHNDPSRWLREHMPLLDQYLRHTGLDFRIYGVSAQGGDLPDKDNPPAKDDLRGFGDQKQLLSLAKASARLRVVGYGATQHDLTHPVRWLSGLEGE
jgi:hypothetical protein